MKKTLCLILALMMILGTAAIAEGKTIVYWSMWDSTEPQGRVIQEAIDKYMADTGNTVDAQFKGRTGIREGLQPALDAGTVVDLFDEDIDRVNVTWGKYIADLEELAKAANYEETANAGLIAACREVAGGTLKSIPYQPNVFAWFYNKDLFEEAGIEIEPKTWEEFLDVCQKLKDAGITPIACDDAYIVCMLGYEIARIAGQDAVIDIVNNGNWAENPAALKAAQAYEDLAAKGFFADTIASAVWPSAQNTELAIGDVAMYLNGSWLPNEVKETTGPDFRWGCFSYTAVPEGTDGPEAANFGAQVFAVNDKSEVKTEAFEIINYITKGEFDNKLSQESLGIPSDSANSEWPEMMACVKPVMDGLQTRYTWAAGIESNVNVTPIIKENFQKLCGGVINAQEFIDAMEAAGK